MRWWKDKTPTDPEIQGASAFVYFVLSVLGGFFWLLGYLYGAADWQTGLLAVANLAVAMFVWWRLRVQFSLRSIFITTTLVAVMLGLIVWAVRK